MILSHTHKFIFICSSRVGTTSMEGVLQPLQEGEEYDFGAWGLFPPKHVPAAMLKGALPEKIWNEYFKFAFVRNPWDWFVSQWFYNPLVAAPPDNLADGAEPDVRGRVRRSAQALRARVYGRSQSASATHVRPSLITEEPITLQARDVDDLFERLKPFRGLPGREGVYQSNWIYDMDGRVLVDFIGRFETIESDFDRICRHLKLDLALPHLNRTAHSDYRKSYSDEARARVGQLWAVDVDNFGYTFDGADDQQD